MRKNKYTLTIEDIDPIPGANVGVKITSGFDQHPPNNEPSTEAERLGMSVAMAFTTMSQSGRYNATLIEVLTKDGTVKESHGTGVFSGINSTTSTQN